jgi:transposase-like protein
VISQTKITTKRCVSQSLLNLPHEKSNIALIYHICGFCNSAQSFESAKKTIDGIESMRMIQKGQLRFIAKGEIIAQNNLVHQLFGLAA